MSGELSRPNWRAELCWSINTELQAAPGTMAIAVVDLDDLKAVNDEYGHPEGDRYLAYVLGALNDCVRGNTVGHDRPERPTDTILSGEALNVSGDEYWIVLRGVGRQADVDTFVDRVRRELDDLGVPASMGGLLHHPGETAKTLIAKADAQARLNKLERVPRLSHQDEARLLGAAALLESMGVMPRQLPKYLAAIALRGVRAGHLEEAAFSVSV